MPSLSSAIGLSDPDRPHRGDEIVRLAKKLTSPPEPDPLAAGGLNASQLPRAPSSLTLFARSGISSMFPSGEIGDGNHAAELLLRHPSMDIDFGGENFEAIIGNFNHIESNIPRFSQPPENNALGENDRVWKRTRLGAGRIVFKYIRMHQVFWGYLHLRVMFSPVGYLVFAFGLNFPLQLTIKPFLLLNI